MHAPHHTVFFLTCEQKLHETGYFTGVNDGDTRQWRKYPTSCRMQSKYEYSSNKSTIWYFPVHCLEDIVNKSSKFISSARCPLIGANELSILVNFCYLLSSVECGRQCICFVHVVHSKPSFTKDGTSNQHNIHLWALEGSHGMWTHAALTHFPCHCLCWHCWKQSHWTIPSAPSPLNLDGMTYLIFLQQVLLKIFEEMHISWSVCHSILVPAW